MSINCRIILTLLIATLLVQASPDTADNATHPAPPPTPAAPAIDQPMIKVQDKVAQVVEPTPQKQAIVTEQAAAVDPPQVETAGGEGAEVRQQVEIQNQKHEEQVKEESQKLRPWISNELILFEQQTEAIVSESFEFILDPEGQFEFRWNPPKNKELRLNILVFQVLSKGEIMLMRDSEETEFIDIQSRDEGKTYFKSFASVYVSKVVKVVFDTDYKDFRLVSKLARSVFVMVDLEKLQEVVPTKGIANDSHFSLASSKLESIEKVLISEEKLREHTYKYEWGFLDNQYAHETKLLGLTGLELVIIIACALTQVYFIKGLLDNRAVV